TRGGVMGRRRHWNHLRNCVEYFVRRNTPYINCTACCSGESRLWPAVACCRLAEGSLLPCECHAAHESKKPPHDNLWDMKKPLRRALLWPLLAALAFGQCLWPRNHIRLFFHDEQIIEPAQEI